MYFESRLQTCLILKESSERLATSCENYSLIDHNLFTQFLTHKRNISALGCQSCSKLQQTKAKIGKFCLSSTPLLKPFCLVAILIAIDIEVGVSIIKDHESTIELLRQTHF